MSRYNPGQRRQLLAVARAALMNCLVRGLSPHTAANAAMAAAQMEPHTAASIDADLLAPGACFVTLWRGERRQLRGCRGEVTAHQPLAAAVAQMALAAALDDPRFAPLALDELPFIRIEISVLSTPAPIQADEVELGKHGLLIVQGSSRGLLLPEVPIEHHLSLDQFLAALCEKAGLSKDAWRDPASSLWGFATESWVED